jgi:two-component system alkaline phosphatase synthesis response regulator PhoP
MMDRIKILIVEDEMPVAMMMAYLLTQTRCEVQTAWNAERGMRLAQTRGFDLITLDVNLPGISGFEICRRLKENPFFQTPIVFVSGQPCEQDVQQGLELGAVDYIIKPFEVTDFIFRIISHAKPKADFDTVPVLEDVVA